MLKIKAFLVLLVSLISLSTFAENTQTISQQALLDALDNADSNTIVLDVRTKEEYDQGHIPGAINMSHDMVESHITQLSQYKNKTVVVHCRSGRRAAFAEVILAKNGFSHLRHLTGDMNGWVDAKLPLVSNNSK